MHAGDELPLLRWQAISPVPGKPSIIVSTISSTQVGAAQLHSADLPWHAVAAFIMGCQASHHDAVCLSAEAHARCRCERRYLQGSSYTLFNSTCQILKLASDFPCCSALYEGTSLCRRTQLKAH